MEHRLGRIVAWQLRVPPLWAVVAGLHRVEVDKVGFWHSTVQATGRCTSAAHICHTMQGPSRYRRGWWVSEELEKVSLVSIHTVLTNLECRESSIQDRCTSIYQRHTQSSWDRLCGCLGWVCGTCSIRFLRLGCSTILDDSFHLYHITFLRKLDLFLPNISNRLLHIKRSQANH